MLVRPVSYILGDSANDSSTPIAAPEIPVGITATRCFARCGYPLTAPVRAVT